MRALLFANGEAPSVSLVAGCHRSGDLIVAADGGARHALANGLIPDAVVGDFDSVDEATRAAIPGDRFHRAARLDTTDLEKSVSYALSLGCDEIEILGAGGGRSDHALANLSVLTAYRGRARIRMHDELFTISSVHGTASIEGPVGTVISLVALGECTGVTTEGLRWPLRDFTLPFGPRGIHNEIASSPAAVSLRTGDLLLFQGRWIEKHA
ncbi:MAG: thiamine diphosphokinase [Dehalococcoidia bacterium]|jgi:thiamine pyrophosphokinase|nr:thiamine diphosphokinase [Dehalococcoidia bacterium]